VHRPPGGHGDARKCCFAGKRLASLGGAQAAFVVHKIDCTPQRAAFPAKQRSTNNVKVSQCHLCDKNN
jgi:hypothetical protein